MSSTLERGRDSPAQILLGGSSSAHPLETAGERRTAILSLLGEKFDRGWAGQNACGGAALDQFADGFLALFAVAQGPLVDIHADKFVGEFGVHVAGKLHGVIERFFAMFQAVADAIADGSEEERR